MKEGELCGEKFGFHKSSDYPYHCLPKRGNYITERERLIMMEKKPEYHKVTEMMFGDGGNSENFCDIYMCSRRIKMDISNVYFRVKP